MFKKQQGQQFVELKSKSGQLRKFTKVKYLGSGGFARCYQVYEQLQGVKKHYAVKIIKKSTLYQSKQLIERLRTEIRLHKKFSEPQELQNTHIVRFIDSFETQDYIYLLLELCINQTLNQLIRRRKILSEQQTRFFIRQLAQGLKQLHSKNVVHRDIKLCNLFLSNGLVLKIGDFGLATEIKQNKKRFTLCGTANYIAPQMIQKDSNGGTIGHGYEVDVWALGVVCYTIYYGRYPFQAQEQQSIYNKIIACKYSFNPYTMRQMKDLNINGLGHFPSQQLQSFIKSIFQIDPAKRLTLDQVLQHPFLNKTSVPKQLPQIALKCQLKKQNIDSLFVEKNIDQQQKNSVSQRQKQNNNFQKCKAPQIIKQDLNQRKVNDDQKNKDQKQKYIPNFQGKDNKFSLNSNENQIQVNKDKKVGKNQKNLQKNQKIYFRFQRKLAKSLSKKNQQHFEMQKRELNSQRSFPKVQKSQKVLIQVILNKNKEIEKNEKNYKQKLGSNGMIIKVYSKQVHCLNQETSLMDRNQDYNNQYSLIIHPKLKYLTKIYDQDKKQRYPLGEVDKLRQNLTIRENNKQKIQKKLKSQGTGQLPQKLRQKKVIKIPLASKKNSNHQLEKLIRKNYQEEFYIVKMVFKKLQDLKPKQTKSLQKVEIQNVRNQQICNMSSKKHRPTSLQDIASQVFSVETDPPLKFRIEMSTKQSLKCH